MRIETMLHKEIEIEFEELKRLQLGTEEYKTTVDGLTKLVDRAIEIDKINIEQEEKTVTRKEETELKLKQMEDEKKDRNVKNVITVGTALLSVGLTVWGTLKSLKFEETGTVTTLVGRNFIGQDAEKADTGAWL